MTNEERKKENVERALYYYFDDITKIQEYTRVILAQTFSSETMRNIFPSTGELDYTNFVQPVIDRLTNIWKEEPIYIINESDTFDIKENFNKLNYYTEIQRLAALTKMLNTICVHIAYRSDETGDYIQFQPFSYLDYCNNDFKVEFDENKNISSYGYKDSRGNFVVWTADNKTIINEKGVKETIPNPYKTLPLVVMQNKKSEYKDISDFWGQPQNQLVNGNNIVNHFINCMNYQANYSGFDVMLIKGISATPQEMKTGTGSASSKIKINPSEAIKTSDPNGDIKTAKLEIYEQQFNKLIQNKIGLAMQSIGLSPDSFVTDFSRLPESGISKIIDSAELIEQLKKFQNVFRKYESELLFKLNTIFKNMRSTDFKFTNIENSNNISIKYYEPEIYRTKEQTQELLIKKLENGLISPVEAIMLEEGITEAEAEAKFNKIVEQKGRLTNAGLINVLGS